MSAYMSGKYFTDYTVLHVVYSYVYLIVALAHYAKCSETLKIILCPSNVLQSDLLLLIKVSVVCC